MLRLGSQGSFSIIYCNWQMLKYHYRRLVQSRNLLSSHGLCEFLACYKSGFPQLRFYTGKVVSRTRFWWTQNCPLKMKLEKVLFFLFVCSVFLVWCKLLPTLLFTTKPSPCYTLVNMHLLRNLMHPCFSLAKSFFWCCSGFSTKSWWEKSSFLPWWKSFTPSG